ncbi:site-specific integrase [Vibrio hangzhouensis]|uniref:Phage integrase family protein n=1 Tax=Vibrio hangzhouensis TaxID=462991 RepID=A0A1H6AFU9_9VIBR|nr:site-specific integrase [Vibrio hangzhouensis]SEG46636.1 Phage integrase family protein [Vibrio hangzhouensis]
MHMTQRANGNWYYQRRIPASSQAFFNNKTSIKVSLRTKSIAEARAKARKLSVEHDTLFSQHEAMGNTVSKPRGYTSSPFESLLDIRSSQNTLDNIAQATVGNLVGTQYLLHANAFAAPQHERESVFTGIEVLRDDLCELMQGLIERGLSERNAKASHTWKLIEGAMETEHLISFNEWSFIQQKQLIVGCCTRMLRPLSLLISQLTDLTAERTELPSASLTYLHEFKGTHTPAPIEHDGLLLSECIDLYISDRETDELRPKTIDRYRARLRLMLFILGDCPIEEIKREEAKTFKSKLLCLPANLNKVARFKGLTVDEVIALEPTPMSTTTANDTLTDVSSFFDWCMANDHINKNSFTKLKVKTKKRASEERNVFTPSDLTTLFQHPYFQGGSCKHPYFYWLPVLGLYTGARLNELCQLHVDDIRQDVENSLWTLTITDMRDDQSTKNRSSVRTIPLHHRLIDLGFIEYVKSLNNERVFPELKQGRDGYGSAPSKWFGRFRDKVLPNAKAEKKTFHSFRHTFTNALKQSGVTASIAGAYVGHGDDSETFGRYGKAYVASALAPVLEQITFDFDIKPFRTS